MLFRLSEVSKTYGGTVEVLRGLSMQINPNEKVGLVGRNGAGKSTVFRLISGEESPETGDVVKARDVKMGFLAQHVEFEDDLTVHEAALSAFERLQKIETEMRHLEERMATTDGDELETVLEKYSALQHDFEVEGGFEYAARAESILQGLGFEREKWHLPTKNLSGGQKNRLGMARLLLSQPDVLLLDEPTNHLDVHAVEWLEDFLAAYDSAYVIISHDRYFLDRTCKKIFEIVHGKADSYTGNYSDFVEEREERREIQRRAFENQQHEIKKTEAFIRKNIAGQKTKQAKSRRNMLERVERLDAVITDKSQGNFNLKNVERAGNNVLMIEDLTVGFADKVLAENINFTLNRGECLGIIGANGTGKTTFLKTVLGKLPALEGEARWGSKTEIGYYAQQLDDLDNNNEIIQELRRVAPISASRGELSDFLARFLFQGDDIFKKVGDLSGGEKGRLALAKLIYSQCNVLVLDEPTNHLDIPSREALESALEAFPGTILTISHDRYFLDRIATQILYFDGKRKTDHYHGNYSEFHEWQQLAVAENAARKTEFKNSKTKVEKNNSTNGDRQPKARKAETIEAEIAALEAQLNDLSVELSQPDVATKPAKLKRLNAEYAQTEIDIKSLYEEWEQVANK